MEHTTPRVNCNMDCELWVTVACQCGFTDYSACTTLVRNVDRWGGVNMGGEHMGNLIHPLEFVINLKALRKFSVFKRKDTFKLKYITKAKNSVYECKSRLNIA